MIRCIALRYGFKLNWGQAERDVLLDAAVKSVHNSLAFCELLEHCIETE